MEKLAEVLVRARPSWLSAVLVLLAFPPFNLWPLLFVALVPWLLALRSLPSGKKAWRSGYAFGFVYGLGQLFWVAQFATKWVGSPLLGALPWLAACGLYALYFGWVGVLIFRSMTTGRRWMVPLAWSGIEVIRSYMPTFAFPWGLLANPLAEVPQLGQAAHFGMIYLVSAALVAFNLGLAEVLAGEKRRGLRWTLGATAFFLINLPLYFAVSARDWSVVAVQPGVDAAFGDRSMRDIELARAVNDLVPDHYDQPDERDFDRLLVMPEGMVTSPEMPPLPLFRIPRHAPIIFGGRRQQGDKLFQTAFLYDGKWQYADKTRLVIFGEFVPFRDVLPFLASSFKLPSGDLVPGEEGVKVFRTGNQVIGPLLCFEGLFPDIAAKQAAQGAQILAVMSIDDWYMGTTAPEQLRQASVWRAIETGLPVVRAASLGYSMQIDANGHVSKIAPLAKPTALVSSPMAANWRLPAPLLLVFPGVSALLAAFLTVFVRRKPELSPSAMP